MKIYCMNRIALNDICIMLNEIYGQNPKFDNYLILVDLNGLKYDLIKKFKEQGYYLVRYDLDHIIGNDWYFKTCEDRLSVNKIDSMCDEIWTYSLENKEYLQSLGFNVKFRPILYSNNLKSNNIYLNPNPPIDVLFYGNLTQRRYKLFEKLQNEKQGMFSFDYIHAIPKHVMDWKISNSKIILNCKADDKHYNQEICRIFYPLINNKCVLSEKSNCDEYAGDNIAYFTWDNVTQTILQLLQNNNYKEFENKGMSYKRLCESGDLYHTSEV